MAKIKFKGNEVNTVGELPKVGSTAKDFVLVAKDLSDVSLKNYQGKKKILNIVPSLDTGVCALSTKKFNEQASKISNTVILVISADLPFAQKRFCEAEGVSHIVSLSTFRSSFGNDYGVTMLDGLLRGLSSRAVVVLDENNKVLYTEQVPEITQEPNYDQALASIK